MFILPSRIRACLLVCFGLAPFSSYAQDALSPIGVQSSNPAVVARQDREAIEQVVQGDKLLDANTVTRLIWEKLQTGDDKAAEQVLAQLSKSGQTGPAFHVQSIEFAPDSKILSKEQLVQLAAQATGKRGTFVDLLRVVVSINKTYRDAGYPLARANLPPQDVEGGVVRIELIEAKLGGVKVQGDFYTPPWVLRSMVRQKPGEAMNLHTIERGLLWYNRTRSGGLGAMLEAGTAFGTTDVLLQIEEPARHELTYVLDNAGRESVGLVRQLGVLQRNNVIGLLDDRMVLGGVYSEGTLSFYGSYDVFLPGRLPRLGFTYSQGETEVVDGPFQALGVDGESQSFEVALTQPLIVNQRWLVQAGLRYAHTWSETDYASLFIQEETVDTVAMDISASRLDKFGGWFAMVQGRYIQGETLGLADEFLAFSGSVLRQHRFGAGLTGSVEARFQWGDDGLPTSERLALGGVQSLRGYAESDVLSDKGYLVRSELAWMPFFEMRPAKPRTLAELGKDFVGSMESFVFLDHGMGIDIELFDASTENRVLTSAGAGLRFAISRFFSLMAVYAQPFDLEDEQEEENFLFRLELRLPWG